MDICKLCYITLTKSVCNSSVDINSLNQYKEAQPTGVNTLIKASLSQAKDFAPEFILLNSISFSNIIKCKNDDRKLESSSKINEIVS